MTEAEKAAKAKQEADEKAAAAAKAKEAEAEEGDEKDDEEEPEEEDETGDDPVKLKAALAKAKTREEKTRKEAIDRRKKNKELVERNERLERGLAIIQGKKEADIDPVEKAQNEAKLKMSRAILRSEIAASAQDAHDPKLLLQVAPEIFKDIEVDLDGETVDAEQLTEALDGLRKSKSFLFKPAEELQDGDPLEKKKGVKPPPKGGQPPKGGGSNVFAQWKALQNAGRKHEADAFYIKNHKELKQMIAANPSLV